MAQKKKTPIKARKQPALNKQQEAEVMRVYNTYWNSYTIGDVEAMAPLLDEDYTQVGSAEAEVFFNKKDAVKFLHDTIDQVAGKAELRNRVIRVEPQKEFVLITELTDLFVLIENEWTFHSRFRASSLMRKRKAGWKFYHQHSSFPDIRAAEGENISIEKVALENIQLRDAVKRRTVDLEQKTRDLEVEAALERVRARAMGMRNSSELAETSAVLFYQIKELGINAIRTGVGIFDDPNNAMELWLTTVSESREVVRILDYVNLHIHPVFENIIPARKEKKSYALTVLKGNEVKQYYNTMSTYLSLPSQKTYNQEESFYSFFFSDGAINVIAAERLSEEECNIMSRLANVFGVIYTRFLDLQKAEAQTREAQIEAALERVRARALAMHSSQELENVAFELRTQLGLLGTSELETCAINLYEESEEDVVAWGAMRPPESKNEIVGFNFLIPKVGVALIEEMLKAHNAGAEEFLLMLEGARMAQWLKVLHEVKPEIFAIVDEATDFSKTGEHRAWFYCAFFPGGTLIMITFSEPDEEPRLLLKRFAQVFGLAYRRFADLKKAEAQTREAQIEAALERVRSRSMAMHKSEELREVIQRVFEQLRQLGFNIDSAGFDMNGKGLDFDLWTAVPGQPYSRRQYVPSFDHAWFNKKKHAKENGLDFFTVRLTHEEKNDFFRHFFKHHKDVPEERQKFIFDSPGVGNSTIVMGNISLVANNYSGILYSEEENAILRRFGKVFEQSYTRFLDLQKAEAQAREAQIEASLERLRSRTMAMHNSEDVTYATETMFEELKKLGSDNLRCGMANIHANRTMDVFGITNLDGGSKMTGFGLFGMDEHPIWQRLFESWSNKEDFNAFLAGREKDEYFNNINSHRGYLPQQIVDFPDNYFQAYSFDQGIVWAYSLQPHGDSDREIMKRFATVFSLTFRRYQDLKNAEVQAREAQIEASLERVRASAMAMHSSEDVVNATSVLFKELHKLGIEPLRCGVLIFNESKTMEVWAATRAKDGHPAKIIGNLDMTLHPLLDGLFDAWKNKEEFYEYHLRGQDRVNYYNTLASIPIYSSWSQFINDPDHSLSAFIFEAGSLYTFAINPFSDETKAVMKRFTSVFSLTFRRYQDLQKAEAQAREAQIEAALERVRSRMMAMHQSEDLPEVMKVITEQFTHLEFDIHAASFLPDIVNTDLHCWISTPQKTFPVETFIPYFDHVIFNRIREVVDSKLDSLVLNVSEEESRSWWNNFLTKSNVSHLSEKGRNIVLSISVMSISMAVMKYTLLSIWNYHGKPFSEEENAILKRFAKVSEQTYTRYLELKKAEAQAREAIIQASLERVRAKAMGMHNSQDLAETIHAFYKELVSMGITPRRCGIGLVEKETRLAELSSMNTTEDGISVETIGTVKLHGHPVFVGIYNHWLEQKEYRPILRGKEIKEYYQFLRKQLDFPDYPTDAVHFGYFFMFQEGGVYAWTEKELQEDELNIYRRFTSVISLTYKRYKDLKDSEARTKEALKQASLDRVRAEIASMRSKEDLDRITPLIWRELTTLGIPFVRCGVFIMHEDQQLAQVFLSTPDGRAIATFHLPYHAANIAEAVNDWREKRIYKAHWGTAEFSSLADTLIEGGQIANREQYLDTLPKEGIFLNYLPFLQGMLYVGHTGALSDDDLNLVQSVADAFSTAYARYEDFNKLEHAKAQIENTLTDLKQTQTQLVQSEKMASLGELTAGIAHEIQNPLNFVNNFSEVSGELLDEMIEEVKKGNLKDIQTLVDDVKQNLDKIHFHGKRADGIVKSMLQHSRKSTNQKEPTDINALCDEYLRLSYHGLRAKDKSFNAKFETQLDPNVGKLNVIPQEIGRVILNLINNAFYAVSEKKKLNLNNYEPTVTVTTKKTEKSIEVRVRDNGIGIPRKVLDKIFNPFFTTKPTGQGTGLGLSLSYDIITKGHGGELKVETKEGEGSEFIVQLPVL